MFLPPRIHLITLFENDRHFSHLSSLEREMTFRTEMGLYYSYFKTIIEAPSFLEGLWMIMNDRLTEYPLVINTVKRFHLYPEVIIAYWYRTIVGTMDLFGLETKTCWNVTRIEPLSEVQSCEGMCTARAKASVVRDTVADGCEYGKIAPRSLGPSPKSSQGSLPSGQSKVLPPPSRSRKIRLSDLIAARILRYTDFDTLIYTCAPEFDFMERAIRLSDLIAARILRYTDFDTLIYTCAPEFDFMERALFGWLFCRIHFENVVFGILTMMSIQGCANLHYQWSIMGEFTNLPQEELIHWIRYNTRPDAVFAGAMPTMASIKLSTLHPIVNHPHYEDADLRARTKIVYSAYSRKPAVEVRDKLLELHVNYYVLEEAWCVVRTKSHITHLFENDRHFSHLSTLEREMAFRTEMGLYYSYFKTIVEAPSFFSGVWMIMNDRLTEYPLVINTLKRFNLYPEVILASWYRIYTKIMDLIGIQTKICWTVTRGEGLSPIESCEGERLCHAIPLSVGTGSRLGGLVTVLCFFFNHGEVGRQKCTRVMWTPPLRESFSYPFLVLQMLLVTHILRATKLYRGSLIALCISNVFFMLPWQFAQFVLLTQVIQGCCWLCGTVTLKYLTSRIFGIADDAHIGNLLTSKFFSYKDFDTLLYTCAAEFDFMERETPLRYTKTLLLPVVLIVFAAIVRKLVYHALQLLAYTALGVLIMRLKLFLTPHMCVMASLICSRQLFEWLFGKVHPGTVVFAVLAAMSIQGSANLQTQWNIVGEFSNLPQEELIEWIRYSTKPDAVFAGAMPTMASVKLSALRPVVNHPHYEDAGLRARTKIVYSMYSRKAAEDVKKELMKLKVNYYILEESWCIRRSKPGCSMPEIWDVEDPANAGKTPLCNILGKDSKPQFNTVFQNSVYKVLEVIKE
ncbi:putative C-mannosyltransferase DPY19L1 [Microtus ochrogaster]|uniref:Putative C-mannosyltransferase DPY19L1 n=2 Tax=Euarchontoglires TaxID=314146 RepID=A0A8J6KN75_MICOH|nr:putative C-mannosyltransferase DPY19L1 [Microtus ochrogaster]